MRLATLAQLIGIVLAALTLGACEPEKDKKDEGDAATAKEDTKCEGAACTGDATEPGEVEGLGLAEMCTYAPGDAGKGCFTCTPRELPNTQCITVPEGFDPAVKCQHDLDRLTCDVGLAEAFVVEFSDRTADEDIYERLPFLVFGAKALLLKKLEGKPELRDLIFKLLDSIDAHKLAIFTGGDIGPIVDDAKPLIKAAKADLTDEQFAAIKTAVQTGATEFHAKRQAGPVTYADAFKVMTTSVNALPPEILGELLKDAKIEEFLATLEGKDGSELLSELTKALGGEQELDDLAAQLGVFGSPGN